MGGRRVVTRAALDAFLAALNPGTQTPAPTPGQRQRAAQKAERELEALGA
jgi:hypothetical protein